MAREKNPVKEIAIFAIGIGLLTGVGGTFILSSKGMSNAPELLGIKRNLAIGLPLIIIAITHLFSGISVLVKRKKWTIHCCRASTVLLAILYFIFEVSTVGFFSTVVFAILIYGAPIAVYLKSIAALEEMA